MKNMSSIWVGTLAVAGLAMSGAASAVPVSVGAVGESFNVDWSFQPAALGAPAGYTVNATALFSVTSISATQLVLALDVSNLLDTNTGGGGYNGGLASIGFSADPNVTSVTFAQLAGGTGAFGGATLGSVPSLGLTEICGWAGNNCAGGGQPGLLAEGTSDNFQITLARAASNLSWSLDNFGIKVQTSFDSFEEYGCVRTQRCDSIPVPEPAALGLLGLGLLGLGLTRRRKTV